MPTPNCLHPDTPALCVCSHCGMVAPPPVTARPRTPTATRTAQKKARVPAVREEEFTAISFFVEGEPITQGSMKAIGRGRMVHVNGKTLSVWRSTIGIAARAAGAQCVGDQTPVRVDCLFYVTRPKSVKRDFPTTRKDTDKLMRAVGDALTGVAYVDDVQVCDWHVAKRYATEDIPAGVWITVTLLHPINM